MSIPIALFAYNRPAHLKLCLEFLENSQARLERRLPLYIFCDAPRTPEQAVAVEETRKVARAWVAKHGGAVIERSKNRGFENITSGITALCEKYGKVIVVEDDVVVAPDFLPYMVEALVKYAEDPQVFMISGFMYFQSQKPSPPTFFLNTAFIWGWATWARAWKHYAWEPEGIVEFLQNPQQRYLFDFYDSFPFSKILEKQFKKECNTWDIQWMYILFQQKGLSLYPHQSLVWNSGVGGGTHGQKSLSQELDKDPLQCKREEYIHGDMELEDFRKPRLQSPLQFPQEVKSDSRALYRLAKTFSKQRGKKSHFLWWKRGVHSLRSILR